MSCAPFPALFFLLYLCNTLPSYHDSLPEAALANLIALIIIMHGQEQRSEFFMAVCTMLHAPSASDNQLQVSCATAVRWRRRPSVASPTAGVAQDCACQCPEIQGARADEQRSQLAHQHTGATAARLMALAS